jgi:hypothetical protein
LTSEEQFPMKQVRSRAAVACLAVAGVAGAALPAVASASDAGLKKTVVRYEKRVGPEAKAWSAADKALTTATSTDNASAATGTFRRGLHSWKLAITPIKTTSTTSAAAKKEILTAIREYDLGLVQYQKALDKLNAGATKSSLKSSIVSSEKRIIAAAKDETTALKELGLVK